MTTIEALHVGGPTLWFSYAGHSFLTDPTFDEPGPHRGRVMLHKLTRPAVAASELGPIDVVLLSHDQHADNLDDAGRALLADVPVVLSTPEAASRIAGLTGLAPWQQYDAGDVTVLAVPALHGPEGCEAVTGTVTGFVLTASGWPTMYVSGDNASVDVVGEIVERVGAIDVAVLHVGAANVGAFGDTDLTLNHRTAVQVAGVLGSATVVPVHAEGWAHFTETLDLLALHFGYAGLADRLQILASGELATIRLTPRGSAGRAR